MIGLNNTSTTNFVAAGTYGSSYLAPINAQAGDVYIILINNFRYYTDIGGPTSGFTIDFAGSTATFNSPPPPIFTENLTTCNPYTGLTIKLDQPIQCSTIATDGSVFQINGVTISSAEGINCNGNIGYTDEIKINFSSPIPDGSYTLTSKNGTDNNTLLNICDVGVTVGTSFNFTVSNRNIKIAKLDTPACQFQTLTLDAYFDCNTIATDSSDFEITGPGNVTIASAQPLQCGTNNVSNKVQINLAAPIMKDGTYTLRVKKGTDNNTIVDTCGRMVLENESVNFIINSYNGKLKALPDGYTCNYNDIIKSFSIK